ncbi:MAG TPA: carboxy-S-adenosyl-L-methionine synthase CmoA [Phycisphaerales bacterium]|nr:carboxy-S-adenosyl-L-methionine synthase CmoA [Phycisphaerales bacterium]
MDKDTIYSMPLAKVGDFRFDEQVVQVFPDMIERSVPGYGSILSMIGELAARYVGEGSHVYDLGCSLGACTKVIRGRIPANCHIHAIDSSQAMIESLRRALEPSEDLATVEVEKADIRDVTIDKASLCVLNFTLQFIAPEGREALLERIFHGLNLGGALVLSEKICFPQENQQELLTDLHHSFKRANGYSDLEIAQKRTALEKTLIPETLETHLKRLERVGFSVATCWFQCFNFVSILAIK